MKICIVGTDLNCLGEAILMNTQNPQTIRKNTIYLLQEKDILSDVLQRCVKIQSINIMLHMMAAENVCQKHPFSI